MKYTAAVVDAVVSELTAQAQYDAWAVELGVSSETSLMNLNGDDGVLRFDLDTGCLETGATNAEFSYEGMVGWSSPVKKRSSNRPPASRMYYVDDIPPDNYFVFRFQYDCMSSGVRLQKANGVTIIGGSIHRLSTPHNNTNQIDFAIRFPENSVDYPKIVLTRNNLLEGETAVFYIQVGAATLSGVLKSPSNVSYVFKIEDVIMRGFGSQIGRTDSNLPQLTLPNPAPSRTQWQSIAVRDYQFGGRGRIVGTVKEKGTPDQPLQRRVQLYDEISMIMTREVWSDIATGEYVFENIDPNLTYSIISYDYTGMYRAVIANGQKAVVNG